MTYTEEVSVYPGFTPNNFLSKKPFLTHCCNGPSCMSLELDYLQRDTFINNTPKKSTKEKRE